LRKLHFFPRLSEVHSDDSSKRPIFEYCGWVVSREYFTVRTAVDDTSNLADVRNVKYCPRGRGARSDNEIGLDTRKLFSQSRDFGCQRRMEIASGERWEGVAMRKRFLFDLEEVEIIKRRARAEDVGAIGLVKGNAHGETHALELAASCSDEGDAFEFLVLARGLAHDHQLGVGRADRAAAGGVEILRGGESCGGGGEGGFHAWPRCAGGSGS
jgi:hypothetical protein